MGWSNLRREVEELFFQEHPLATAARINRVDFDREENDRKRGFRVYRPRRAELIDPERERAAVERAATGCAYCGEPFEPSSRSMTKIYCGRSCLAAAAYRREGTARHASRKSWEPVLRTCARCGEPFKPVGPAVGAQKYCGAGCRVAAQNEMGAERKKAERMLKGRAPRMCACGVSFEIGPRQGRLTRCEACRLVEAVPAAVAALGRAVEGLAHAAGAFGPPNGEEPV